MPGPTNLRECIDWPAGEIIPQAICSRYGLQVGAYSAWFVRGLMFVCAAIAWPISKILDHILGHEQEVCHRDCFLSVPSETIVGSVCDL